MLVCLCWLLTVSHDKLLLSVYIPHVTVDIAALLNLAALQGLHSDMTKLHVILGRYLAPLSEIEAATPAHREWLNQHYRSGVFITSGPQEPRTGGVILAAGESAEQLLALMQGDPFYQAGLAEYQVIAFHPVKRSSKIDLEGVPLIE